MNHARLSRSNPAASRHAGFTLIELMITVAIVGILAAVAMPSYKNYIRRGQQPEAFNTLSDYRTKMEQYYQDNHNYGGSATTCADNAAAASWNTFPKSLKYFKYTCVPDTTAGDTTQQSYTITATGISGLVTGDIYTINQNGDRQTTVFRGGSVSAACWLSSTATC